MQQQDPHRLNGIKRTLSLVLSALFAVLGILGYQSTADLAQLMIFLAISAGSFVVIHILFNLVERVLNSLDDSK